MKRSVVGRSLSATTLVPGSETLEQGGFVTTSTYFLSVLQNYGKATVVGDGMMSPYHNQPKLL